MRSQWLPRWLLKESNEVVNVEYLEQNMIHYTHHEILAIIIIMTIQHVEDLIVRKVLTLRITFYVLLIKLKILILILFIYMLKYQITTLYVV